MKDSAIADAVVLAGVLWIVGRLLAPKGSTSISPPEHVGPDETDKYFCRHAPWQSFGIACRGYTWDLVDGAPKELRRRVASTLNDSVF